jgi:hypothetical protein
MTRIEKKENQPWHWLNRLHKSYKVASAWIWLTDGIAVFLILLSLSGLVIFRYTWLDIILMICGGLVMGLGMLLA